MNDKLPILILYAVAGLLVALWPTIYLYFRSSVNISSSVIIPKNEPKLIVYLLLIIGAGLMGLGTTATPKLIIAFSSVVGFSVIRQRRPQVYILAMLAGLIVATTLPWWRRNPWPVLHLSWMEMAIFTTVTALTVWVLEKEDTSSDHSPNHYCLRLLPFGLFFVIAFALSFTTGLATPGSFHHWGAYIGPAELLIAGARIFYDFPAQYGLGPTLIIASTCGNSCFNGMYFVVGFFTVAYSLLIAFIASNYTKSASKCGIVLLLVLVICFIWISYPAQICLPTSCPSTGGLRFLPVLGFVSVLIWMDKATSVASLNLWAGHIVWIAAALWSPESAFYVSFVWWPYYIFIQVAGSTSHFDRSIKLLKAIGILLAVLICTVIVFVAVYWSFYRTIPKLYAYLAYALNPPGPLPISPNGSVWFFIFAMLLGIITDYKTLANSGNTAVFRRGFLLSLMTFSSFSYFLGRSHENNILNLIPLLFLLLLNTHAMSLPGSWQRGASVVLIASLLGWAIVFGFPKASDIFEYDFQRFREKVSAAIDFRNGEDPRRAISYIRDNFNEPITIIDAGMRLASTSSSTSVWCAIHGPANYAFIPSMHRREFLRNTSSSLHRSGWLMIDKSPMATDWTSDFDSVYTRTQELDFGTYWVIRYEPRIQP